MTQTNNKNQQLRRPSQPGRRFAILALRGATSAPVVPVVPVVRSVAASAAVTGAVAVPKLADLSRALRAALVTALCGLVAAPLQASIDLPDVQPGQVGKVTLALGKAWIEGADGNRVPVRIGTAVSVSDTITTATGGHVHVRFVDTALVSIRPSSTLEIVRYDYDPARPADSAVKLNLLEGETRAISGDAAKNARENFRMNTPIAAIGVRGTDFSVIANSTEMQVLVTEGAVVVAPFSGDCLAEALGPCSATGLELTMDSRQILQFSANTPEPVLLPIAAPEVAETLVAQDQSPTPPAPAAEKEREGDGELYVDSVGSRAVNGKIATTRNQPRPETPVQPPVVPPTTPPVVEPPPPTTPIYTPPTPVSEIALLTNSQLVWGRYAQDSQDSWYSESANPLDRLVVDQDVARKSGREPIVTNNTYTLFRPEPGGNKLVQPGLGVLGFTLGQAQAVYKSGGVDELMSVLGGELAIDFDRKSFATSLQLDHAATGAVTFSDSGRIFDYGNFFSRSENQRMAGSVSVDGAEAGYVFDKTLENGSIEGITLWNKQP